ncbi:hypothetical protein BaRGS_00006544 [Batillaria attramentaria]|uniref:Uncharacterized protein n=1 Tax=Batillaria attramentaria TaxID=370345 RepID=A0ABD0LRM0_9CAEN
MSVPPNHFSTPPHSPAISPPPPSYPSPLRPTVTIHLCCCFMPHLSPSCPVSASQFGPPSYEKAPAICRLLRSPRSRARCHSPVLTLTFSFGRKKKTLGTTYTP